MTDVAHPASLDEVAEELYALPLRDFIRVRTVHVRAARRNGDPSAAAAISEMAKPDGGAWMANQLVRQRRDQVEAWLVLARALRTAPAAPDVEARKSLTNRFVWADIDLFGQAMLLARPAGVGLSRKSLDGLQDTLHSAGCTEEMTQLFLLARLTRPLPRVGWPGLKPTDLAEIAAVNGGGFGTRNGPASPRISAAAAPVDELARYRARRSESTGPGRPRTEGQLGSVTQLFAPRRQGRGHRARLEHVAGK
jgi:hypothetical protein